MLTKNLTPFLLGTRACSTRRGRLEMTVVVRGTFAMDPREPLRVLRALDRGFLTAEVLADDDDPASEAVYPGDLAEIKLNAEVVLRASCNPPGGKPVPECPVRVSVGAWSKALMVYGPRFWTEGLLGSITPPKSFATMPITYANAFGGKGLAANPVGKGLRGVEVPNVIAPGQHVSARDDRPAPSGFGPINATWPPRAGKLGTRYDRAWRDTRAPYPSEDFDWTCMHAAPADQQLQGFLRGDEEFTLQNMHPRAAVYTTRLPGQRVRVFVHDDRARFREVPLRLDTLFADVDAERLYLTWRGLDEVRTDDLTDVKTVLVAAEDLASEPRDAEHYRAQLLAFERDPVGLEDRLSPEFKALRAQAEATDRAAVTSPTPPTPPTPPTSAAEALAARLGPLAVGPEAAVLQRQMASALATMPTLPGAPAPEARVLEALARTPPLAERVPPAQTHKPGYIPATGLRRQMRAVADDVAQMRARLAAAPERPGAPSTGPDVAAQLAQLDALVADPRWTQLDPDYAPPAPLSTDAPGPGRNLVDHDLSGRDLAGCDLTNADLSGALLVGAKLAGARLRGARLRGAVLFRADLAGCDLTGADLSRCNATEVHAPGADLTDALLDVACLARANLADAKLTRARGAYAYLVGANLARADLTRAELENLELSKGVLTGARLCDADLRSGRFIAVDATEADFTRAKLTGCSFQHATLRRARLTEAKGSGSFWSDAVLDEADLTYTWLVAAHFTGASATRADFTAANLRDARMDRATLDDALFVRANLLRVNLCKAKMSRARFTGANLYEAMLYQAGGAGCDFTDANLRGSTLERWK